MQQVKHSKYSRNIASMAIIILIFPILIICQAVESCQNVGDLPPVKEWWENANFYQIYPRSFKDTNGDGIGDLKGITEKVSYLKELGVTGTWLSPIFKSPMVDFGYDISDYLSIQPEYGTMSDFENLVIKCKELGIKLILDFVPNHTSNEHEWFIKSVANDSEYRDFYVWHPGKLVNGVRQPPNNWISFFRFSAWEWNEQRQAYYLHQFAKQQPDLNYRNPKVVEKMKDVLRFWLEKGVSGFRIDIVPALFEIAPDENGSLPDEPRSYYCEDTEGHCYLKHIYTQDQNETLDMVYQWHEVMEEYKSQNGGERKILMTESYSKLDVVMQYFGNGNRNGSQIPFNFELLTSTNINSTASDINRIINSFLEKMPNGVHANWVLGNHDQKRLASRLGVPKIDLYNIMMKTLPGIAITYNGEEIGMTDVYISWNDTVDPQACNTNSSVYHENSRDPARTPFQWDSSTNAGFSTANKTWLPVGEDFTTVNVQAQETAGRSHLKVFKKLLQLRKEPSLDYGTYESRLVGSNIFVYKREVKGQAPFVVVLNFGKTTEKISVKTLFTALPDRMKVVTSSILCPFKEGSSIDTNNVTIIPETGMVLSN